LARVSQSRTRSFLSPEEQIRLQAAHLFVPGVVPLALVRHHRYRDAARALSHRILHRVA
jgi:hypothetical protein